MDGELMVLNREAAEQAARQRQREEEAEARRKAKKMEPALNDRPTARAPERADSAGERPAHLRNLLGSTGKPTWRDHEIAKANNAPGSDAGPSTDRGPSEQVSTRKPGGYVPPALRGRTASPADSGLAPRNTPRSFAGGREGSPAEGTSPRPGSSYLRGGRDESPAASSVSSKFAAGDPRGTRPREETSAADGAGSSASLSSGVPGVYRPGAFRKARESGQ